MPSIAPAPGLPTSIAPVGAPQAAAGPALDSAPLSGGQRFSQGMDKFINSPAAMAGISMLMNNGKMDPQMLMRQLMMGRGPLGGG